MSLYKVSIEKGFNPYRGFRLKRDLSQLDQFPWLLRNIRKSIFSSGGGGGRGLLNLVVGLGGEVMYAVPSIHKLNMVNTMGGGKLET